MKVKLKKSSLRGTLIAPPSKSYAHRALFCAAFSNGKTTISNIEYSDDINATINCLETLGAKISKKDNMCIVSGIENIESDVILDCNESGSTYRFLIPIIISFGINAKIIGKQSLLNRPISVYNDIFNKEKTLIELNDSKLIIHGDSLNDYYELRGDVSSQFVTGLMLASAAVKKSIIMKVLPPIESKPYIDMTISMLKIFGIKVDVKENIDNSILYIVNSESGLKSHDYFIEGDYSNTAVFDAINDYSRITIVGLNCETLQGDKIYKDYFKKIREGFTELDIGDYPDIAPILLSYSTFYDGVKLINTNRLAYKECDRGAAMKEELQKCGIDLLIEDNSISIVSPRLTEPTSSIDSHNDHRIVMAMATIGLRTGKMTINGAEAINKSYNSFFEHINELSGKVEIIN